MNKVLLKGILFVLIGAISYGLLATFVRLAYNEGYTTTEVIGSQYLLGLIVIGGLVLFNGKAKRDGTSPSNDRYTHLKLIISGTCYGLTGVFYYLAVRYIPVSICVVLLMQTIWMGIVLESILTRKWPDINKCIAVVVVLTGTFLATNVLANNKTVDVRGILWGLAAALMYTIILFVPNRVALTMHPQKKSFWILLGATIILLAIGLSQLPMQFDVSIFWKWGLLLALFGTILPPILFNTGLPKTGIGLGSIIIAIEIPVSVSMAYVLLNEKVLAIQWVGIVLILASIVLINFSTLKKELHLKNVH